MMNESKAAQKARTILNIEHPNQGREMMPDLKDPSITRWTQKAKQASLVTWGIHHHHHQLDLLDFFLDSFSRLHFFQCWWHLPSLWFPAFIPALTDIFLSSCACRAHHVICIFWLVSSGENPLYHFYHGSPRQPPEIGQLLQKGLRLWEKGVRQGMERCR